MNSTELKAARFPLHIEGIREVRAILDSSANITPQKEKDKGILTIAFTSLNIAQHKYLSELFEFDANCLIGYAVSFFTSKKVMEYIPIGELQPFESLTELEYVRVYRVGKRRKFVDVTGRIFVKCNNCIWKFPEQTSY